MSRIDDLIFAPISSLEAPVENLRHTGKYGDEEIILLGHNAKNDNCLIVLLSELSQDDRANLLTIVRSDAAQKLFFLVPLLMKEPYKNGASWFFHLIESQREREIPRTQLIVSNQQQNAKWLAQI